MFTKGHQYGVRFSAANQPKKNGRKPSLYKKLKALTGEEIVLRDAAIGRLRQSGMDVITNTEEGAEGAGYGEWKGCEVECQEKKHLKPSPL